MMKIKPNEECFSILNLTKRVLFVRKRKDMLTGEDKIEISEERDKK